MEQSDKYYLEKAIQQGKCCISVTGAYNVGALLVKDGTILATGYSRELPGNTHAEECCFLKLNETDLTNATLYTTMEPCSTRLSGKKSCTQKVLEFGIKRVVIGVKEPDNFVNCEGTEILLKNGVEVVYLNELEKECKELNKHLC